jgi:hypothetical protein
MNEQQDVQVSSQLAANVNASLKRHSCCSTWTSCTNSK